MARPAVAPMSRRAAKAAGPHPGTSKPLTLFATACQIAQHGAVDKLALLRVDARSLAHWISLRNLATPKAVELLKPPAFSRDGYGQQATTGGA